MISRRSSQVWHHLICCFALLLGSGAEGAGSPSASVSYLNEPFPALANDRLGVCSFNIQWLGSRLHRRNTELAGLIKNCDAIVIQELVAPPWDVTIVNPSGVQETIAGDQQSADFVTAMAAVGFDGVSLGPNRTSPKVEVSNGTTAEWPLLFFKKKKIKLAPALPSGFLAPQIAGHPIYSRVPYAFALSSVASGLDFVLISVHLRPTSSDESKLYSKARRIAEFQLIADWIDWQKENHRSHERDFFVLGDMNVEDLEEYEGFFGKFSDALGPVVDEVISAEGVKSRVRKLPFKSLNFSGNSLFATNVLMTKPYDHIMYNTKDLSVKLVDRLEIIDMATSLRMADFPSYRDFIEVYSDHNPIRMQIMTTDGDKD